MTNPYAPPESVSAPVPGRKTSLARGLAWAIPLGICGFCVPFAVLGVGPVLRLVSGGATSFDRSSELWILARDGAASALVCSLVFASAAVANFSPARGVGYLLSLVVMGLYAFVALIAATVIDSRFLSHPESPRGVRDLHVWLYLTCQYLRVFPLTFLPGVIAFTYWQMWRCRRQGGPTLTPPAS